VAQHPRSGTKWQYGQGKPFNFSAGTARSEVISTPEAMDMNMRNPMGLLVLRLAELLDRSLFEVPDVDDLLGRPSLVTTGLSPHVRFPTLQSAGKTQSTRC
jgi:hypothetical protein